MCKHGTTINLEVTICTDNKAIKRIKPIDSCIAPIVAALEKGGVLMRSSCCGHGKRNLFERLLGRESTGSIILDDGRELIIRKWKDLR